MPVLTLTGGKALGKFMLSESFDLCSSSSGAAILLRSNWVALVNAELWECLTFRNPSGR